MQNNDTIIEKYIDFVNSYFSLEGCSFSSHNPPNVNIRDYYTKETIEMPQKKSFKIQKGNKTVYLEVWVSEESPKYKYFSINWEIEDLPTASIEGFKGFLLNPETIKEAGAIFNKESIIDSSNLFENLEEVVDYFNKE